jgi:hypothetical protein
MLKPLACLARARTVALALGLLAPIIALPAQNDPGPIEIGLAVRDITPEGPIWLAGYAARQKPSEQVDAPLLVQACAIKTGEERVVLVALDNCEVSREFMAPVLREVNGDFQLKPGAVMVVSSHTHSAPVLEGPLMPMYRLSDADAERVRRYGLGLKAKLYEVVRDALADLKPAQLEYGVGRATFAMNRRVYNGDRIDFGENPDGPVDHDVPVLKVTGTNATVRAILFGYACHGTSIQGDDFSIVSGDYMAYARQHLEAHFPGATALYFTGMGADSNPSPRGKLLEAKRHGLELAGAVASVLDRPMRPVRGPLRLAYAELDLPLEPAPSREQLDKDAQDEDFHIRNRATAWLKLLAAGQALPKSVTLPLATVRFGDDLTLLAMGGEVVVDYSIRFKRLFAADHPWTIGYAYEVPCYIPSVRILKEGGYEAHSSLIYYGLYGPLRTQIERTLVEAMTQLVAQTRTR